MAKRKSIGERRLEIEDIPKRVVLDGKRYHYHFAVLTRGGALKEIKKLRERGYFARALKWAGGIGWLIYKRKR